MLGSVGQAVGDALGDATRLGLADEVLGNLGGAGDRGHGIAGDDLDALARLGGPSGDDDFTVALTELALVGVQQLPALPVGEGDTAGLQQGDDGVVTDLSLVAGLGVQQAGVGVGHEVGDGLLRVGLGGADEAHGAATDPAGGVQAGQRLAVLAEDAAALVGDDVPLGVEGQALDGAGGISDGAVDGLDGPVAVLAGAGDVAVAGQAGALGAQADVDVLVDEEDFEYDEGSQAALASSNQQRQVVKALEGYAMQEPEDLTASHRIHIHLFSAPHEVLTDDDGHVVGLRTERTRLTGDGNVTGTGEYRDWPVPAVYRAVGYASSAIEGLPFDTERHVVPNEGGRVLGEDGKPLTGLYATGWIRRGPVGLIGSTKSDAQETITNLVADANAGLLHAETSDEAQVGHDAIIALLESRGIPFTNWEGWELLDAYERELGEDYGEVVVTGGASKPRERVKVVSRDAMTAISRSTEVPEDLIGQPEAGRVPERVAHRLAD